MPVVGNDLYKETNLSPGNNGHHVGWKVRLSCIYGRFLTPTKSFVLLLIRSTLKLETFSRLSSGSDSKRPGWNSLRSPLHNVYSW